ncbi:MAG TPA: hypothetical protein VI011_15245, partial [Asanoa sp.]
MDARRARLALALIAALAPGAIPASPARCTAKPSAQSTSATGSGKRAPASTARWVVLTATMPAAARCWANGARPVRSAVC